MSWTHLFEERYSRARREARGFPSRAVRDLTVLDLAGGFSLVVAVDSDGGIGPREHDVVRVSDYLLGRFAMRVPLLEIVSSGAAPIAAFDMLTMSMGGGGSEIVRGIRAELVEAGLPEDFPLSGSTEDNVPTTMTGVGTTVIGVVAEKDFRPGSSKAGDVVLCAGVPKSGPDDEIRLDDPEIVRPAEIADLRGIEGVHDLLPVGSSGVAHEALVMAQSAGLAFADAAGPPPVDTAKSAGPSTCVLLSMRPSAVDAVADAVTAPVTTVGWLSAR